MHQLTNSSHVSGGKEILISCTGSPVWPERLDLLDIDGLNLEVTHLDLPRIGHKAIDLCGGTGVK